MKVPAKIIDIASKWAAMVCESNKESKKYDMALYRESFIEGWNHAHCTCPESTGIKYINKPVERNESCPVHGIAPEREG